MPFIQKVRIFFKTRLIFPRIDGPIVLTRDHASNVCNDVGFIDGSQEVVYL